MALDPTLIETADQPIIIRQSSRRKGSFKSYVPPFMAPSNFQCKKSTNHLLVSFV